MCKGVKDIPKEKYENIFKGAYNRTEKYVKKPSNRTRKLKNTCLKIRVALNVQKCKT